MKKTWLFLPGLMLLAVPAAQAQFTCTTNTNNNSITITKYTGPGGAVTIPGMITGLPVTSIGTNAFFQCYALTSLTITNSVTSIGNQAFAQCASLISIAITNSVTSIGNLAFAGCTSLTGATLPNSVANIGNQAFDGCSSLRSVTIPNSVTNLGSRAFEDCISLSSVTIPNSLTNIPQAAFAGCNMLTNITIPNSVTTIGAEALEYCAFLPSVTIPGSVTNIGDAAFANCASLASVTLPNSITNIGASAFYACSGLTNVTIPACITNIGNQFYGCPIMTVTINDGVTYISGTEFDGCSSLASVTISDTVTSIGGGAFQGCTNLAAINVASNNPVYASVAGVLFNQSQTLLIQYPVGNRAASFHITNGVTNIAPNAFQGCTRLASITITNSVTNIGALAFAFCTSLGSVTMSNTVTNIADFAFKNCISLTNVTIPGCATNIGNQFYGCPMTSVTIGNGVASIGDWGFSNAANLTSVRIPNTVTNIGESAFHGCANLAGITIPASVTSISDNAFAGCTSLANVSMTNGVTSIGADAFQFCTNLGSVTFGTGLTNIGGAAFANCSNLTGAYFADNAPTADCSVFAGDNVTVYYLQGTTGWSSNFACLPTVMWTIGSFQATLTPAAAISAGAQWRVDAGTWQNSGAIVSNLSLGKHKASFKAVSTWRTPTSQTISVTTNWFARATGDYVGIPQIGSLQVTINPPAAVLAGAKWEVDGGVPQISGATVANLSVGDHIVSFNTISGWTTPSNQTVRTAQGSTAKTTGLYALGNLKLTITSPQSGLSVTNARLPVTGTVSDKVAVSGVFYQLNGGAWTPATPGTSWNHWTIDLILNRLGQNTLGAYAQDTSGAFSLTNTVSFNYIAFLPAQGTYLGLFAPANAPRQQTNSGAITFSVTSTGAVSGKLTIGTNSPSFSGQFDIGGAATIITPRQGLSTLTNTLQLSVDDQSVQGTVGDGSFLAELSADKEVFSSTRKATNYQGQYTLIIPGTNNPAVGPFGSGCGTVTVSASGVITFGGFLADGTIVNQSSVVSKDGWWPFYLPLYGNNGSFWSWNRFTNKAVVSPASASWINATNTALTAAYRMGFTNESAMVAGSAFNPASKPLLALSQGQILLEGGNLPAITNSFILTLKNAIILTNASDTNHLTLTITNSSGLIGGSFADPSNPGQKIQVRGVLLQSQTNAAGYFIGTNQSGSFLLENR